MINGRVEMMMRWLVEYRHLLHRYDAMIRTQNWWEGGRRERIADRMAELWDAMPGMMQQQALGYATELYQRCLV